MIRSLAKLGRTIPVVVALGLSVTVVTAPAASAAPTRAGAGGAAAGETTGWQTYRDLGQSLPDLTQETQTQSFSSFDRTGGNADYNHCQLTMANGGCVLAQHSGPGEIDFIWTTSNGGDVTQTGNIHVVLDGKTVLDAPEQSVVDGSLGAPFVYPLVANARESSGGDYVMVPMPFRQSMQVWTDHNPVYYNVWYQSFASARGVTTFDPSDPASDVLAKLKAAGTADPKAPQPGATTQSSDLSLAPGASATLATLHGPGEISALQLRLPQLVAPSSTDQQQTAASDDVLENARLRISFDGTQTVDAPLGQFFGSGLGLYSVRALMYAMDPATKTMSAWWPMPYARSATVTLYNGSNQAITGGQARVTAARSARAAQALGPAGSAGYFHATSDDQQTTPGKDYLFLRTAGWGKFVGVSETMRGPTSRQYLEGDIHVSVDGSRTPQIDGTGTEDFYLGGWYFDNGTFTNPFNGETAHETQADGCQQDCTSAYRSTLTDAIPFHSQIKIGIEHGPVDDVAAEYASTAYWYGRDQEARATTDTLSVGDPSSEAAHDYTSADPGSVITLTSTFEGDDGPYNGAQPMTQTHTLRETTSPVSFQMRVDPANQGVTLRRLSDQDSGYQSAEVYVDGTDAGAWLEPLSNPYHRWLEDFFQIPPGLTADRGSINVRIDPTAGSPPWSAAQYQALSGVRPFTDNHPPSRVTGLTVSGTPASTVTLSWQEATDNVSVDHYDVYASDTSGFRPGPANLVGTTVTNTFTETGVVHTRYYRVVAVDEAGHSGPVSTQVSFTAPAIVVTTTQQDLDLASGGWSQVAYTVANNQNTTADMTFSGLAPAGVRATLSQSSEPIPADGSVRVTVDLTSGGPSTGSGTFTLTATDTANGLSGVSSTELHFTSDLALNTYGSAWPAMSATSNQSPYPPSFAADGNASTFWVSGNPPPTPTTPLFLEVNFGAPVSVASVSMLPRPNYGPKDYTIQTSDDGQNWTTVATVTGAPPSSAMTTAVTPAVNVQYVRLLMTDTYQASGDTDQIAELTVTGP